MPFNSLPGMRTAMGIRTTTSRRRAGRRVREARTSRRGAICIGIRRLGRRGDVARGRLSGTGWLAAWRRWRRWWRGERSVNSSSLQTFDRSINQCAELSPCRVHEARQVLGDHFHSSATFNIRPSPTLSYFVCWKDHPFHHLM